MAGPREGSLDAPTRHPIDWKNPEYYDEAKIVAWLDRLAALLRDEAPELASRLVSVLQYELSRATEHFQCDLAGNLPAVAGSSQQLSHILLRTHDTGKSQYRIRRIIGMDGQHHPTPRARCVGQQ